MRLLDIKITALHLGIFFFIIITIIFFYPSIFSAKAPLPTDLLYDYLLDKPKEGANPLIRDSLVQLFPYTDFIYKSYKNGKIPLWNPYIFNGINFSATGQLDIYSPFNLLIPLFSSSIAFFKFKIILFFFLSGFALFLFLYCRKYPFCLCALGGLIWQLSGPIVGWLSWGTIAGVIIWLPLIVLSLEQFFKKQEVKWLLLLTLFNFFSLTGGHLQFYFYVFVFSCGYLLYLAIKHYKNIQTKGKLSLVFFLAINAFLVYLIISPFLENVKISHRINIVDTSHLSYRNISQLVMPNFWGNHLNYHGPLNYLESLIYLGIIPLLILFLVISNKKNFHIRKNMFWLLSLALLVIYNAFPTAFFPLTKLFPFLKSFPPFRSIFLIVFIFIILTVKFLNDLKTIPKSKFEKKLRYFFLTVSTCCLLFIVILIIKNNKLDISWSAFWYKQVFHLIFFTVLSLLSIYLYFKNKMKFKPLIYSFILLAFFDQYLILGNFNPQQEITPILNPPLYIKFLQNQKIKEPLIYSELTPTNLYSLYNIKSIFGYDTNYPESYYQLIKQNSNIISHRNILNAEVYNHQFLEKLKVNFIITEKEIDNLEKIFDYDGIKIYKLVGK